MWKQTEVSPAAVTSHGSPTQAVQGGVFTTYRDGLLVLEDPLDYSYLRAVLYFGGTARMCGKPQS